MDQVNSWPFLAMTLPPPRCSLPAAHYNMQSAGLAQYPHTKRQVALHSALLYVT